MLWHCGKLSPQTGSGASALPLKGPWRGLRSLSGPPWGLQTLGCLVGSSVEAKHRGHFASQNAMQTFSRTLQPAQQLLTPDSSSKPGDSESNSLTRSARPCARWMILRFANFLLTFLWKGCSEWSGVNSQCVPPYTPLMPHFPFQVPILFRTRTKSDTDPGSKEVWEAWYKCLGFVCLFWKISLYLLYLVSARMLQVLSQQSSEQRESFPAEFKPIDIFFFFF